MTGTVTYIDGGVRYASGEISLIERDGKVTEVVVETDGGATFIPAAQVVTYEQDSE